MNSIYYTFLDFGTISMCDYISHSCLLIFVCLRICFHGAQLLTDAIKRKRDTYVTSGKIPDFAFQCIPVLSCGSLHQNTRSLLHVLSDAALLNRRATEMEFKLLLQELNGTEVYAQLRNHLSPEGSSRYSI